MRCRQGLGWGVSRAIDPSQLLPDRAINAKWEYIGVDLGGLEIWPWLKLSSQCTVSSDAFWAGNGLGIWQKSRNFELVADAVVMWDCDMKLLRRTPPTPNQWLEWIRFARNPCQESRTLFPALDHENVITKLCFNFDVFRVGNGTCLKLKSLLLECRIKITPLFPSKTPF